MIVKGSTLDIVFNDEFLRNHFIFAASFCASIVGYKLTPQHKAMLVEMVKFKFYGEHRVLAIGDGLFINYLL